MHEINFNLSIPHPMVTIENEYESEDDNTPLSVLAKQLKSNNSKKTKRKKTMKWNEDIFKPDAMEVQDEEWDIKNRRTWTPFQYFCQYFHDEFWELMAEQSNIRALQDNKPPIRASASEYKKLVGSSIIMGCMKLPRVRMYYKRNLQIPLATQLPRDRFFKLRNYMHLVDNLRISEEHKKLNKLWKVQPAIEALLKKCRTLPHTKHLSVDEQMIPFTGTSSLRQYVKNKPNPVGLKNFILATPQGLVLDFFVYQGASTWPSGKPEPELGIGGSVVKRLTENVTPGHTIFMDRYFTSCALFEFLREKSIRGVGTIMNCRVPAVVKQKLKTDKALLANGRGAFQELVREDKSMALMKWMDNRSVLVLSSAEGSQPVTEVKRWDKKANKYVVIPRPNVITAYNNSMGGVDLNDRMISYYRIAQKTKKWPVRFIFHCMDLAIVNSWIEYRLDRKFLGVPNRTIMDLLAFKIYIGECLALDADAKDSNRMQDENYIPPDTSGREVKTGTFKSVPPAEVRHTSNKHLPLCAVDDKQKFMRCRNQGCTGKTRFKCSHCDVFLCIQPQRQCFFEFHN